MKKSWRSGVITDYDLWLDPGVTDPAKVADLMKPFDSRLMRVNELDKITDPDRWQPWRTPVPDGGTYGRFLIQKFLMPQWA